MNYKKREYMSDKKQKILKIINIITNVLLYTFFVICMCLLSITILSKKDSDGAVNVFGHQLRVVISESMEKHDETYDEIKQYDIKDLPIKTMVFIEIVPNDPKEAKQWYEDIEVGDVLTFKYLYDNRQETITHRVIDKELNKDNDGYLISLRGDNKGTTTQAGIQYIDTSEVDSPNYIVGKVVGQSYPVGLLVTALKSPIGIVLVVILPCSILLILEVIKLVNYFNSGKKKKQQEEADKQREEIEELKRQIKALSEKNSSSDETSE